MHSVNQIVIFCIVIVIVYFIWMKIEDQLLLEATQQLLYEAEAIYNDDKSSIWRMLLRIIPFDSSLWKPSLPCDISGFHEVSVPLEKDTLKCLEWYSSTELKNLKEHHILRRAEYTFVAIIAVLFIAIVAIKIGVVVMSTWKGTHLKNNPIGNRTRDAPVFGNFLYISPTKSKVGGENTGGGGREGENRGGGGGGGENRGGGGGVNLQLPNDFAQLMWRKIDIVTKISNIERAIKNNEGAQEKARKDCVKARVTGVLHENIIGKLDKELAELEAEFDNNKKKSKWQIITEKLRHAHEEEEEENYLIKIGEVLKHGSLLELNAVLQDVVTQYMSCMASLIKEAETLLEITKMESRIDKKNIVIDKLQESLQEARDITIKLEDLLELRKKGVLGTDSLDGITFDGEKLTFERELSIDDYEERTVILTPVPKEFYEKDVEDLEHSLESEHNITLIYNPLEDDSMVEIILKGKTTDLQNAADQLTTKLHEFNEQGEKTNKGWW